MHKKIPNLEGYNGTDGLEDNMPEEGGVFDSSLDNVDTHWVDEEDYNREIDVPVWMRV